MGDFLPEGTRGEGVPVWAEEYSTQLYRELVEVVDRDLAARGFPYALDVDAGVLSFTPPGLPPQQFELWVFADDCRWKERSTWPDLIKETLDCVIGTRTADAVTLDQLAADWNLAAGWLRVHFVRAWEVEERFDRVWWEVAHGLNAMLEYGLPHRNQPVPLEHVQGWGRSRDELFRVAVQNVRSWPKLPCTQLDIDGWEPAAIYGPERLYYDDLGTDEFYRVAHQNHFPASHLLFLEDYLDPVPSAGVVLAVPTDREFQVYFLTERANLAFLRTHARGIGEEYLEACGGVSPYLYWWRDGALTLLSDPATNEVRPPAEFLAVLT